MHARRVYKDLGELSPKLFRWISPFRWYITFNFRKTCLKIYDLDLVKMLLTSGLAWQVAFKKTEVKLELLNDIDMLLITKKGIRREISHAIHGDAKANNK